MKYLSWKIILYFKIALGLFFSGPVLRVSKKQNQAFSYNILTGIYEFCTPKICFSSKLLQAKKTANGQRGLTMKHDAKWARLLALP